MESNLSCLSSLAEENPEAYVQPSYRESYRLAIYALLCGGKEAYREFLRAEQISYFLSEEEILFILSNAELPVVEDEPKGTQTTDEVGSSTYSPTASYEEVPDLELGWPGVSPESADTSISLLFQPPRQNTPTIKEVVRRQIQEAREVIAIAMDVFTDADIFKELINAALRGVGVYILLDDSQVGGFLDMSHSVGINVHDIKNLRVRTVKGDEYQCQSGQKFHGGLEQKFLLVDCKTVLYGTYSFTWSFEKINLSMVLVVTGQLVSQYDEEFRRLYARSVVPAALSRWGHPVPYLRDPVAVQSPNASRLSLNQVPMRSTVLHNTRGAQHDRFNNSYMLGRGVSVQESLHQSHCADMGSLVRGHSYGGELQKLNFMTRSRMGTQDVKNPPERPESRLRGGRQLPQANRMYHRHQTRYGTDQNLIPFNSETSLNRWKIDTYVNENGMSPGASCDAISPLMSPYSSLTGLNEHQSQLIHSRSRDIKSRLEEIRQKRLSLQDYANFRQSQESLSPFYSSIERQKCMQGGRDIRQSEAEMVQSTQNRGRMDDSASPYSIRTNADQKTRQALHWHEPAFSRTKADADSDLKLADAMLKIPHSAQSSGLGIQNSRLMESLTEIPEEKELPNHGLSLGSTVGEKTEKICKDDKDPLGENLGESIIPAGVAHVSQHSSTDFLPSLEKGNESTALNNLNASAGCHPVVEGQSDHTEIGQTQPEASDTWKKNSVGTKALIVDEKKASKKERTTKKSQSPRLSRSHSDAEKHKSPFSRLTPQRLSKRKTNLAADQEPVSRSTPGSDKTEKVYSKYEYFLSPGSISDNARSSSLHRQDGGHAAFQTHGTTDNKLGRLMQRVGNLISKNK